MSEAEIESLPLHYIWVLFRRQDVERFYDDLRSAQITALLANVHRAAGAPPAEPLQFVTVPCGYEADPSDQAHEVFMAMAAATAAKKLTN